MPYERVFRCPECDEHSDEHETTCHLCSAELSCCVCHCEDCSEDFCRPCYEDRFSEDVCPDCQRERNEDIKLKTHNVYGHEAKPEWSFYKNDWENTTYIGIELEVDSLNSKGLKVPVELLAKDIEFIWKEDGSLDNGAELVTAPHTWQYGRKLKWKETLEQLAKHGRSHDTSTCGLHVHISYPKNNHNFKDKLQATVSGMRDLIERFSRREISSLERWANIPNTAKAKKLEDVSLAWARWRNSEGRYTAVNFTFETAEYRFFRGTLKHETFRANIQFCLALHEFAEQSSIALFWDFDSNRILSAFLDFLRANNRYQLAYKYLVKSGYIRSQVPMVFEQPKRFDAALAADVGRQLEANNLLNAHPNDVNLTPAELALIRDPDIDIWPTIDASIISQAGAYMNAAYDIVQSPANGIDPIPLPSREEMNAELERARQIYMQAEQRRIQAQADNSIERWSRLVQNSIFPIR